MILQTLMKHCHQLVVWANQRHIFCVDIAISKSVNPRRLIDKRNEILPQFFVCNFQGHDRFDQLELIEKRKSPSKQSGDHVVLVQEASDHPTRVHFQVVELKDYTSERACEFLEIGV